MVRLPTMMISEAVILLVELVSGHGVSKIVR